VGGEAARNEFSEKGDSYLEPGAQSDSRAADSNKDASLKNRAFAEEPWFAKLPPELRAAIQAKTRRRAPRGYEERLRRYFQGDN